jgi:tRNA-splicing ligase RtcB
VEAAQRLADLVPPADALSEPGLLTMATNEGPHQLGTLGTGNHFLELQCDEDDRLWLMVHSGSRGIGQAIRAAHIARASRSRSGLKFLDASAPTGNAYVRDMQWARRFAAASRRAMLAAVAGAASTQFGWSWLEETYFDCDHNHINVEDHFGANCFVHRKGAIAAHREEPGIVPGSMAAPSFHVTGRGEAEALRSSAHGAGRAMSREEARSRVGRRRLLQELRDVYVDPRSASGLREEAPSAYKDIHAVMKAQRKLVRIQRTLLPILTYKGVSK